MGALRRQIQDVKREIAAADTPAPAATPGAPERRQPISTDTPAIQQLRAQLRAADIGIQEKRREQAAIQAHLAMYEDRVQSSPQVEAEWKELTRDDSTAQSFYNELLAKTERNKMASDLEKHSEGEQFRVMDAPNLPDSPSYPKVQLFAGGGLLLGLALGMGIAAFREYKDTTLRNERDIWAFTRLPTLGIISVAGEIPDADPTPPGRIRGFFRWLFGPVGRVLGKLKRKPADPQSPGKPPRMPKDTLVDSHV